MCDNSGIKCGECGSYNTTREKGGLVRKLHGTLVEETFEPGTVGGPPEEDGSLTPPETPTRDQTDSTSHSSGWWCGFPREMRFDIKVLPLACHFTPNRPKIINSLNLRNIYIYLLYTWLSNFI